MYKISQAVLFVKHSYTKQLIKLFIDKSLMYKYNRNNENFIPIGGTLYG